MACDRVRGMRLSRRPRGIVPAANIKIGWRNREIDGLGEPLPERHRAVLRARAIAGWCSPATDKLRDTPVDTPVELTIGSAVDLALTLDNRERRTGDESVGAADATRECSAASAGAATRRPAPVLFELRQGPIEELENLRVSGASRETQRKSGDYMWRFDVPANGEATLSYKLRGKIDPDMLSLGCASFADIEIFAFSTFDTGQPDLVCSAISMKVLSSMLGIFATHTRSLCVMANPSPTFSSRTAASVWMESAVNPALPRPADSAIEKQAACAAPMSSSGFVPGPSSKRALNP